MLVWQFGAQPIPANIAGYTIIYRTNTVHTQLHIPSITVYNCRGLLFLDCLSVSWRRNRHQLLSHTLPYCPPPPLPHPLVTSTQEPTRTDRHWQRLLCSNHTHCSPLLTVHLLLVVPNRFQRSQVPFPFQN